MKIADEELQVLEELHHYGTPLDATVLQEARVARRGLEIVQTGNCVENAVYAEASGGLGIAVSVDIENVSERIIWLEAVRLNMPWPAADFHWLKRLSSKEVRECGGYVLSSWGPCGFDPAVVLNHCLVRDFKLYPEDRIEGLLLGEGTASVPDEYQERMLIPMQLFIYTGRGDSYRAWLKLAVRRRGQGRSSESIDKKMQPGSVRAEKVMA
jgi:hypothetical protein